MSAPDQDKPETPEPEIIPPEKRQSPRGKRRGKGKTFTVKQKAFVQAIADPKNPSATQAAIRAGYSEKTAGQIAHELLKKPEIEEEVARLRLRRAERLEISGDRALQNIAHIAEEATLDRNHGVALRANELLAKATGVLVERKQVTQISGNVTEMRDLWETMQARRAKRVAATLVKGGSDQ